MGSAAITASARRPTGTLCAAGRTRTRRGHGNIVVRAVPSIGVEVARGAERRCVLVPGGVSGCEVV